MGLPFRRMDSGHKEPKHEDKFLFKLYDACLWQLCGNMIYVWWRGSILHLAITQVYLSLAARPRYFKSFPHCRRNDFMRRERDFEHLDLQMLRICSGTGKGDCGSKSDQTVAFQPNVNYSAQISYWILWQYQILILLRSHNSEVIWMLTKRN